jgi:hypothetical protein
MMEPWEEAGRETDRLCSRFVCRVSGAPSSGIDALRAGRTLEILSQILESDRRAEAGREEISRIFFGAIGAATEKPHRNRLLGLKRSLYNGKPASGAQLEEACALLPSGDAESVRAYNEVLAGRVRLEDELARAHGEESAELRSRFRALLDDPSFRKGIMISSRSLHGAIGRYVAAGGALSGKDEKTERGLLRYYTRMAMKATPFSTFCAIIPGTFTADEDGAALYRVEGDPATKQSYVRVNKLLYGILVDHLKARPDVRRALVVEANPTLRGEGNRLVFLTAIDSREVFQRVPANEVLQLISGVFRSRPAPTLGDLVTALSEDPQIEATLEEAGAYLDKLLEIGFLRFHTGIREQDADWDLPLRALLDRIDDDHARQSSELLGRVREYTEAYATAGPEERARIIEELHATINAAFEAMEVKGRLRKDMPFYEDATAPASAGIALTPGLRRTVDDYVQWARLTSRLAWPRPEQATMRHFFDTFYTEAKSVPLLQFYEDFYREHFKSHVEKEQKLRAGISREELKDYDVGNPFGLEFIKSMNTARARLADVIQARWREAGENADEVSIPLAEVEEALREVEPQPVPCRSVSSFTCLVPPRSEGEDPRLILQGASYTAGYGKYFSRFLYMLPGEVTEQVRQDNAAVTGDLLAEICGDSQFNANLHPPLMRWEISYPTGESGNAEEQLRSSALFVEPDPEDPHALMLRHAPTGKRVIPVDLGFLNPRMRPPLYQLLSRFTPPVTFAPSIPESPVKRQEPAPAETPAAEAAKADAAAPAGAAAEAAAAPAAEGEAAPAAEAPAPAPRISYRPRISVEGRVVLARKRWLVPGALFPQRQADETAAEFFLRASRWRAENGIPETAYVRISPLPDAPPKPGEAAPQQAVPAEQEAAMGEDAPAAAAEEHEEEETPAAAAPAAEGEAAGGETPAEGTPAGGEKAPAKPRTAGSRDLHKPQFIDFGNPLLVGLLGKMGANLKNYHAIIEERLPDVQDLPRVNGEPYVTEQVIQLYFPAGAVTAAPDALAAGEEEHAGV